MSLSKRIIRCMGPEEYKNHGVWIYSSNLISYLEKNNKEIIVFTIHFPARSIARFFYQYFILPFKIRKYRKNSEIIFYDEHYFPLLLFFKANIIVHHIYFKERMFLFRIMPFLLKFAKRIITVSNYTKLELINLGLFSDKIFVLYNSIDCELFKGENKDKDNQKIKVILHVGVDIERKNIISLYKALCLLDLSYLFVRIGAPLDTSLRKKHIDFIKKHNLNVLHLNNIDKKELYGWYQKADLFVFPSIFEGFGRPPIEAQSFGCPVISSRNGALNEILGESCLYIDNPNDPKDIAEKINKVLGSSKLSDQLVLSGYKNSKKYNIEVIGKRFLDLFGL